MVEHLCDLYFVYEGLFSVLLREGGLFPEGLYGHLLLVLQIDPEVHGRKVSLPESFFSLEKIMEVELIHNVLELHLPLLNFLRVIAVKLLRVIIGADELYAGGRSEDLLLWFVLGPEDLEDSVEADHESAFAGLGLEGVVEDCFWGQHQDNGGGVVRLEEEGSGEGGVGGEELVVLLEEFTLLGEVHLYNYIRLQYTTALVTAGRQVGMVKGEHKMQGRRGKG